MSIKYETVSQMHINRDEDNNEEEDESQDEISSPIDFIAFVSWAALNYELKYPLIVKIDRFEVKSPSNETKKRVRLPPSETKIAQEALAGTICVRTLRQALERDTVVEEPSIVLTVNLRNNFVTSISIVKSPFVLPSKLVKILNLCVPYQDELHTVILRRCSFGQEFLENFCKMLTLSNITDVILDYSDLPGEKFYVLLEEQTSLKYLSLATCNISDDVCEEIAKRLTYGAIAATQLLALDLSGNKLTDLAAKHLGAMLRSNRTLLHLNLCNNRLTDGGALMLFDSLKEFPLTFDEIIDFKTKLFEFSLKSITVRERCEKDMFGDSMVCYRRAPTSESGRESSMVYSTPKSHRNRIKSTKRVIVAETPMKSDSDCAWRKDHPRRYRSSSLSPRCYRKRRSRRDQSHVINEEILIDSMVYNIVGSFDHPFGANGSKAVDGYRYATGNFVLCSLNLGFNDLETWSVNRLIKTLKYQSSISNAKGTGLLRVVLDGNRIAPDCTDMVLLNALLNMRNTAKSPSGRVGGVSNSKS